MFLQCTSLLKALQWSNFGPAKPGQISKFSFNQFQTLLSIPLGLSRDKIWREKLFLGLVQNESKVHRLISICTKPRKSFSRQIIFRDKPPAYLLIHTSSCYFLGVKGGLFGIHTCCIHYRPSIWMIQSITSAVRSFLLHET